jgi:HPt (histidine-containing phosphotransfer) domain-containing protein
VTAVDPTVVRAALSELAQRFMQRARAEIATAGALLERARGGEQAALEELHHLIHRLHGSGAAFGFGAISQRARAVEQLCEELSRDAGLPRAEREQLYARLAAQLAELGAEISATP